jgi:hypothetical protein
LGGEDFTKILKKEIIGIRSEPLIKGRIWTVNHPGGISGFQGFERERKRHYIVIPRIAKSEVFGGVALGHRTGSRGEGLREEPKSR